MSHLDIGVAGEPEGGVQALFFSVKHARDILKINGNVSSLSDIYF